MQYILSIIRSNNWLAMMLAVVAGVFLVVGGVGAATTISTNISTAGTVTVGSDGTGADVTFYGDTAGSFWLWDQSADTMIINAGTASTSALRVGDEDNATTINGLVMGFCTIASVDVVGTSTTMATCSGATGVDSGDRVFVQATSSLSELFAIHAASTTAAGAIQVDIVGLGTPAVTVSTGIHSFNFWAVR